MPSPHAWQRRGFTLIEIMVVVVILGILAALVAPNVIRRIDDAQVTKAKQDMRAYETALNLYKMDNYKYPSTPTRRCPRRSSRSRPTRTCATGSKAAISAAAASTRIRGRTTTSTSNPARTASTTCTRSAPTARRAAKAPTPTGATGRSRVSLRSARAHPGLHAPRGPGRHRHHRRDRLDGTLSIGVLGARPRGRRRDASASGGPAPGTRGSGAAEPSTSPSSIDDRLRIPAIRRLGATRGPRSSTTSCTRSATAGGLRLRLWLEDREIVLKPRLPDAPEGREQEVAAAGHSAVERRHRAVRVAHRAR